MIATVTEHLRRHLLSGLGYQRRLPDMKTLRETEWNAEFEMLMRNRLVVGTFRYGTFKRHPEDKARAVNLAIQRLKDYRETGNKECLVDVANFMLIEFTQSTGKFYTVEDRHEEDPTHDRG